MGTKETTDQTMNLQEGIENELQQLNLPPLTVKEEIIISAITATVNEVFYINTAIVMHLMNQHKASAEQAKEWLENVREVTMKETQT